MKCRFSECVILDKCIYFYEIGTGMYAKIDLSNREVSYLDNPDGLHSTRGGDDVYYLRTFAGKIYAVDNNGENINVLDLEKNTYTRIPIYCNYAPWDNFVGCEIIGDIMYLFLRGRKAFLKFNLITYEVKMIEYDENTTFYKTVKLDEDRILLFAKERYYAIYTCSTSAFEIFEHNLSLEVADVGFSPSGKMYLLTCEGDLYKVQLGKPFYFEYINNLSVNSTDRKSCLVVADVGVVAFPYKRDGEITYLRFDDNKVHTFHSNIQYDNVGWSVFKGKCTDGKQFFLASRMLDYLISVNLDNLEIQLNDFKVNPENKISNLIKDNAILYEDDLKLEDFLHKIINKAERI